MNTNISKESSQGGTLGLMACVAIIVGGMIGSAIFSLSGLTIVDAGPSATVSWIIAAVIMLIYALCVAELSTIFPKSGGVFVFPAKALGKNPQQGSLWGWLSTWGYINANIVAVAFSAVYISIYLGAGFGISNEWQVPLAIISILFCLLLNALRVAVAGKVNGILVSGLVLALGIFIVVAFFGDKWNTTLLTPFFSQGQAGIFGFLSAVPTAMMAYGSIVAIAFMVGDVKNPQKNVPKSILIAMAIVAFLYVMVILATSGIITAEFLQENPGLTYIPLYAAANSKLTAFPWLSKVISIAAILALLTTMLVLIALTSRAMQASSENKLLPKLFAKKGKGGTPLFSSAIFSLVSIALACFPVFTQDIIGFAALFSVVTITINFISLIVARKKFPNGENRFHAPGGKILPIAGMALIAVCYIPDIANGGWLIWVYSIIWYAVGFAIYWFSNARKGL